jgi:DNA-binding MarR family transcriptional regulator
MEIDKEIKSKFKNNRHKALVNLIYTFNWYKDLMKDVLATYNLQSQHYNILRIAKGKHPKPVTPGYIKEVMLDKGRDITRLADKLVKEGYINRQFSPKNRRSVEITLTDKGRTLVNKLSKELDAKIDRHLGLNEKEAEQLSNLLDKLRG